MINKFDKSDDYKQLKESFDTYYTEKLLPILQKSEKTRYKYLFCFAILLLLALFLYPYILQIVLYSSPDNNTGIILGATCGIIMILCGPLYAYRKRAKTDIMPDFANFFGNFRYDYQEKIPDTYLKNSALFKEYNSSTGDDYFIGTYADVKITISEEKLQHISRDYRNLEIKKNIFTGICILFEMNKNFSGHTVVLKDHGVLNVFHKIPGLQKVILEDSGFERYFEVYSDDQIEARYLLTTGFMERILHLRDLYDGKSIQMCFNNNQLLLAIPTTQNMFEANSFFRSNINRRKIDTVFEQFYTIFSIVKLLKLNQKIGM